MERIFLLILISCSIISPQRITGLCRPLSTWGPPQGYNKDDLPPIDSRTPLALGWCTLRKMYFCFLSIIPDVIMLRIIVWHIRNFINRKLHHNFFFSQKTRKSTRCQAPTEGTNTRQSSGKR